MQKSNTSEVPLKEDSLTTLVMRFDAILATFSEITV
jgi:hypothetical protein